LESPERFASGFFVLLLVPLFYANALRLLFSFASPKEKSSKKEKATSGNGSACQKGSTLVSHCSSQLGGAEFSAY
jgi:hypothetical protein